MAGALGEVLPGDVGAGLGGKAVLTQGEPVAQVGVGGGGQGGKRAGVGEDCDLPGRVQGAQQGRQRNGGNAGEGVGALQGAAERGVDFLQVGEACAEVGAGEQVAAEVDAVVGLGVVRGVQGEVGDGAVWRGEGGELVAVHAQGGEVQGGVNDLAFAAPYAHCADGLAGLDGERGRGGFARCIRIAGRGRGCRLRRGAQFHAGGGVFLQLKLRGNLGQGALDQAARGALGGHAGSGASGDSGSCAAVVCCRRKPARCSFWLDTGASAMRRSPR